MSTAHVVFIHSRGSTPPRRPRPDELSGVYRLRRMIEPALAAESCLRFAPEELDQLQSRIPSFTRRSRQDYLAHRAFHIELLRPAATHWDLLVLRPLWEQTDALGYRLGGGAPPELDRCAATCNDLIAAFRTRDPETVRASTLRHLGESERVARRLLRAVS